jgi:hypothetical protein
MFGTHDTKHIALSIFLEREDGPSTSVQCRNKYFHKVLGRTDQKSNVREWETDALALGQYNLTMKELPSFSQMHMNAYMGKDDVCMDLHISKVGFQESDRPLFDEVFSSVRVQQARP